MYFGARHLADICSFVRICGEYILFFIKYFYFPSNLKSIVEGYLKIMLCFPYIFLVYFISG